MAEGLERNVARKLDLDNEQIPPPNSMRVRQRLSEERVRCRTIRPITILPLSLLLLLIAAPASLAWTTLPMVANDRPLLGHHHQPFVRTILRKNNHDCQRHLTKIAMMLPSADQVTEMIQAAATTPAVVTPEEEAAMLTDLANASSDLVLLLDAPETILLRFSAVVGKLLELTSDYLPTHEIRSDELVSNLPILATSLFLLLRSIDPIIRAQFVELDEMDLAAFDLCFRPVGISSTQFRSMKATGCFEWIECEAGTVLIDEDDYNNPTEKVDCGEDDEGNDGEEGSRPDYWKYLYWQYNGDVIRSFQGKVFGSIERVDGMHINNPAAQGLLGDTRFLINLEEEEQVGQKKTQRDHHQMHPIATITIGPRGARLLRIDGRKLFELMEHDQRLESSIRLLLLKSLKLKIGNLLVALQDDERGEGNDSRATDNPAIMEDGQQDTTKLPL